MAAQTEIISENPASPFSNWSEEEVRWLYENFEFLKTVLDDFETRIAALEVFHP